MPRSIKKFFTVLFFLSLCYPLYLGYKYYQRCTYLPVRYPFICGNAFRHASDHFFDQPCKMRILLTGKSFNPKQVQDGDIVFIKNHPAYLKKFFANVHPHINAKYILLSHQGDMGTPGAFSHYLNDEKIIAWCSCNVATPNNPKMVALPLGVIGILQHKLPWNCEDILGKILIDIKKDRIKKTNLFYFNVSICTNPTERGKPLDILRNQKFCTTTSRKPYEQYLREMATFKFVISPHGTGLDCYRTWEALMLGCIPVVKTSVLDPLYKDLPVLIVNAWEEITEEFLNKKYDEMASKNYKLEKLSIDYWIEVINACKFRNILKTQELDYVK
ncbi:exostosin family protein [Candidatus Dependentiae bacterium]|nr:exostosin family protein [Candidatus Dependentiae bacterium]